jgi:hypothetical protein
VVAVLGEKIIRGAGELIGCAFECGFDFFVGSESEAVKNFTAKSASGRFGFGLGPVHASHTTILVATIGIFFSVDNNTGMEERGADGPENR